MRRWGGWLLLSIWALALAACGKIPNAGVTTATPAAATPAVRSVRIIGELGLTGRDDASGVQVYIPGTPWVSITGPRGRYELRGVEEGDYAVMARAEGFETRQLSLVSVPEEPTTSTIVIPREVLKPLRAEAGTTTTAQNTGRIEGRVAVTGRAPADLTLCQVELADTAYRTACDRDGRFLLWSIPPGTYRVRARLEPYASQVVRVQVPAVGVANTTVTLAAPERPVGTRRITGLVEMRAPDGAQTADYDRVIVHLDNIPEKDTVLKPDGTFAISGLTPDRYIVTASAPGYDDAVPVEVDLTQAPETAVQLRMGASPLTATPAPTATLRGKAVKNQPGTTDMSGITVAVTGTSIMATTDTDGNFALTGVPTGSRRLIAQSAGFEDQRVGPVELTAGQELQLDTITLEPQIDRPRVISTEPVNGARNVVIDREIPIAIRFNKKMNSDSIRRAIRVFPDVDYRVYTGKDLPTTDFDLTFVTLLGVGGNPVHFRTQYRITVGLEARDVDGNAMLRPYEMNIRTSGPSIIGTIPVERGVTTGSPNDPIVIRFNAPIDPSTLTNRSLRFTPRVVPDPKFSIATEPESGWSRLLVQATLDPDTPYRITFGQAVRTINNLPLDNTPFTFSFRTSRQYPYVPPAVPRQVR